MWLLSKLFSCFCTPQLAQQGRTTALLLVRTFFWRLQLLKRSREETDFPFLVDAQTMDIKLGEEKLEGRTSHNVHMGAS